MKVYVVVVQSCYEGVRNLFTYSYSSLKDAKAKLQEEMKKALSIVEDDDVCEFDKPEADLKNYNCDPIKEDLMNWGIWNIGACYTDYLNIDIIENEVA